MAVNKTHHAEDAKRLAELGYKQQFERKWSGFSNFAVSFSIISILSGCFTTFSQAWNNGGPVAIAVGWPIIASLILIIGFCMAELVSAMPTAGGIYYWSFKLGKPIHGWLTGWLNLVGLIAVIAGVDYGFATFFTFTVSLFNPAWSIENLGLVFIVFLVTVITHVMINVFGAKIIHWMQNVNVYWHVVGVAAIVLILVFIPEQHQSLEWMFTTQINNSGWTSYWFYVLPLGFLLTQYTITGFDASAHVSEETSNASVAAAKGIWQSIFYAGIGGWILLLSMLYAATNVEEINKNFGFSPIVLLTSLPQNFAVIILVISLVGQYLCGMSCVTAASRMLFAFSRDGAVPGSKWLKKVDGNKNPSNAAVGAAAAAIVLTLPALYAPEGTVVPVAFFAVTSVTVIGLFVSFAIPIFLRWRMGDKFKQGPWNLGNKWKWMAPVAVLEIAIISIYFMLPTTPAGMPGNENFTWLAFQYSPIAMLIVIGGAMIWWYAGARKWFKGPKSDL